MLRRRLSSSAAAREEASRLAESAGLEGEALEKGRLEETCGPLLNAMSGSG